MRFVDFLVVFVVTVLLVRTAFFLVVVVMVFFWLLTIDTPACRQRVEPLRKKVGKSHADRRNLKLFCILFRTLQAPVKPPDEQHHWPVSQINDNQFRYIAIILILLVITASLSIGAKVCYQV